jgi:hypothetical protein
VVLASSASTGLASSTSEAVIKAIFFIVCLPPLQNLKLYNAKSK